MSTGIIKKECEALLPKGGFCFSDNPPSLSNAAYWQGYTCVSPTPFTLISFLEEIVAFEEVNLGDDLGSIVFYNLDIVRHNP